MVDRAKLLIQKRTSLKSKIINLSNLLDKDKINGVELRLRGARLTELYHAYEEYSDELAVLDPSDAHTDEFADIQERFYILAGRIENTLNAANASSVGANVSNEEAQSNNGSMVERRPIKLLERPYEVKRILISRHLSGILNLPALEEETTNSLSILADDAQQHIASLSALGVSVAPEIVVHILENKLPKATLEKWEATLERNEFPKLDQMYDFLYKTAAVCALRREKVL
ncbi:uncharacterized protein LOC105202814 isoform X1 [Solenopsis invicta]|uniref:uncharacterized protein LOC105202814 isoform X1 n=1 Tax=Solenopsis invicta TaxID=13686 RepID=UPI00193CB60E|nr:uncharacterized protein LOC105202814 isoform X1 [Solenopsis invicta]XP_011169798.2 uncharacterized protein LOC105202814 isoform X1 [Solenopsis invicta]XP_039314130.1 uncharacterized protein LOC105202814 isoform X1 [Solenopsis invicta]